MWTDTPMKKKKKTGTDEEELVGKDMASVEYSYV